MQLIMLLAQIPPQIEFRLLITHTSHKYFNKQALWRSTLPYLFHTDACAHCRRVWGCESSRSCSCAKRGGGIFVPEANTHSRQVPETPFTYFLPVKSCFKVARGKSRKMKTKAIISLQHLALREYSTTVPPLATGSLHRKRNENDADIMGSDSGLPDWAASWKAQIWLCFWRDHYYSKIPGGAQPSAYAAKCVQP